MDGKIEMGEFMVSAHCNRVMVEDGHTETISVSLKSKATLADITEAWRAYRSLPQERDLPSAPKHPIIVREERDRPQPKFDLNAENGMATVVGTPARMPCAAIQIRCVQPQYDSRRGRRGAAECGIDEVRRISRLPGNI